MDKMMSKRGVALVGVVLGLIVIVLIVYGLGNVSYQFAKEKIFGEKGVFARTPGQKEFVPYTGPPLTEEERKVLNSVHALRCALNSVALGEFKPNDPDVCPAPLVAAPPEIAMTGKAWALVTGRVTEPKSYDTVSVQCDGVQATKVKVPALEAPALRTIVQEVLNCKAKALDPNLPASTRCAHMSVLDWEGQSYDEARLEKYMTENKMEFKGWEGAIDWLTSWDKVALQNRIEVETFNNKIEKHNQYDSMLCVDFVRGTIMNYISINGCDKDGIKEVFACNVKSFELPQEVNKGVGSLFIQAFGDPRWLVYYESFPQEAAEYWHKDWRDLFNVWTVSTIAVSGALNMFGGLGKAAKVSKAAAKEAQALAKEGTEALVKKGITEAEKQLIERLGKAGVQNTMKSLLLEEGLAAGGLTPAAARRIANEVFEVVGKRSGERAFQKSREVLEQRIGKVLSEELPTVTEASRKQLLSQIMEGEGAVMRLGNQEIKGGVRALVTRNLEKELTGNIIKKRAYEQMLDSFITKEGTINAQLLAHHGEAALNSLNAIARMSPTAAQKAWAGTREIIDIFMSGTLGGFNTRNFPKLWKPNELFGFIAAQSPIKLSGRGFVVGGTAVKTVAGLPGWVATHSYPTMLLIAWFVAAQDASNEKFRPVGANSLAINQPTLLGPTLPLGLNDAVSKMFITLKDTSGFDKFGQRMYFVSPCKANIKVSKAKCTCYKNPQMHKFTYPSGTINVEPGSVMPLPDDVLEKRFRERWATKAKAVQGENWRAQWNALAGDSKAKYGSYERYAEEQFVDVEFDKYESDFFSNVISPVGGLVRGRDGVINFLAGTRNVYSGLSPSMVADMYASQYDATNAIKRCDQSEYVKSAMTVFGGVILYDTFISGWAGSGRVYSGEFDPAVRERLRMELLKDEYFKSDCLEVEPQRLDGTYCYDHFPQTAWFRALVMVGSLALDAVIIGFTGGLATPLALLATGLVSATVDVGLEAFEKWP